MKGNQLSWLENEAADQIRIDNFCLMDDDFFSEVFDGNNEALEFLLSTVLERDGIEVIRVDTQVEYRNAVKRSIRIDARILDAQGRVYDVEVQRDEDELSPQRGRYHSSVIDRPLLKKGQDFKEIPDSFVIFISESDPYNNGKPMYHIKRRVDELDLAPYNDGNTIIYVNGEFRDLEHPIGRMMHDFKCKNASDMLIPELAKTVRFYKETEGGRRKMCKAMQEMRNETAVKATISAYFDVDIRDEETIIKKLLAKFAFLTEETAERYVREMEALPA